MEAKDSSYTAELVSCRCVGQPLSECRITQDINIHVIRFFHNRSTVTKFTRDEISILSNRRKQGRLVRKFLIRKGKRTL
jgi:hypothetical protein